MSQSEQIADLAKALSRAQAKISGAKRDSRNPHLRTTYADLASVWEACRAALTENGLSVVQTLDDSQCEDNQICVVTTLLHESGQWIQGRLRMVATRTSRQGEQVDPQVVGSAITYARRYSLAALVGVAPEDDDAETAMQRRPSVTAVSRPSGKRAGEATETVPSQTKAIQAGPPESAGTRSDADKADRQEARQLANDILKLVHDGVLTADEVKRYGGIQSVNDAVKASDVQALRRAYFLLSEFLKQEKSIALPEAIPV